MSSNRSPMYLDGLVRELCKFPKETEWLEFKVNDTRPADIGEYVSALANSAALLERPMAYIVWGVENDTHAVVGTEFDPWAAKGGGNEDLEGWLVRLLSPRVNFTFHQVDVDGKRVIVMEFERAARQPVQFQGNEWIRVGSYKKRLKDFPEKERALWRVFDRHPFEFAIAAERIDDPEVLHLLDYPEYFELTHRPLPDNRAGILAALREDRLVEPCEAGGWNILNLGAILFARRLTDFDGLKRKAPRVILYEGRSRSASGKEQELQRGYACAFEPLIQYVNGLLPSNEVMGQALRRQVAMYPELAIREVIANALIHQDLFISGTGPMIEIFLDRVEVTNPGVPLMDPLRFVDTPPRSRNEALAALMRRMGICEERGSGWDKVVEQTELYQLPPPRAEKTEDHTRVTLFSHKAVGNMDREERVHACYLHACLKYVMRDYLTNASLRDRFGVEERNKATVSRYIREAVDQQLIKPYDEDAGRKYMKYVPFWAS